MIISSAPGKLLLFGEHAVVYGYPCLVTAVSERMKVSMEKSGDSALKIDSGAVKDTRFVEKAIENTQKKLKIPNGGLNIKTDCAFSGVYGFGSSSAVTTAVIFALSGLYQKKISNRDVFDIAYKTVLDVQKVGSGADVAAASLGGILYYQKGGNPIEPVSFTDRSSDASFIVGYSGIKSSTVDIVNNVAQKYASQKEKVERIFRAISQIVEQAKTKITEGDWERVGKLMTFNQDYLRDLGVSCQKLEDLISAAVSAGAWGAKLSGAGGGDCMIALCSKNKEDAVKAAIEKAGGTVVNVSPNEEGVRLEDLNNIKEL